MKRLKLTLFLAGLTLFISGCQGPNSTAQLPTDMTLPVVENIKTLSDMNAIGLEWIPVGDGRVSGYYVYRSNPKTNSQSLDRVATIDDRYVSHYVDTKLEPQTNYVYAMSTFSDTKQESQISPQVSAATTQNIEPIPFITVVSNLPNRTKLIWRPHPSQRVSSYVVERSDLARDDWKQIATVNGRLNAEYIDKGLSDSKSYKYRVKAKTHDGLVSAPTEVVKGQTKDLPLMVENLQTTNDLPKSVVLTWDRVAQEGISYYKVYRSSNPSLLFSYHAKTVDNTFEDLINDNGVARYYFVTAVDKDELESPRQKVSAKGSTLPAPQEPAINVLKYDSKGVLIGWNDISQRAVKFQVVKKSGSNTTTFTNIEKNSFADNDVTPKTEYTYNVYTIDKYGLTSKASEKIVVVIPEF
ncbi:MAG: hypothetical protein LBG67_05345 [Campylobacteraceae bacterium]|jgi:fibronectin type 3 domain-containing protein|nr:hypothetical protein [Campylobacteraceae bacterium]